MWVLGYHHHHHGVVGQNTRWIRRQVRRLGHAVVMRSLWGGVAMLAGSSWTMATPQAATGGVFWFTTAARTWVCSSSLSTCWGGFIPSAHSAARTFTRAAPISLAPCGPTASAAWGEAENVNKSANWLKIKTYISLSTCAYLHCADCRCCRGRSCSWTARDMVEAGWRRHALGRADRGKCASWAMERHQGEAREPKCPGPRPRWSHHCHSGSDWPCLGGR